MSLTKRIDHKFVALFLALLFGSAFIGILVGTFGYKIGIPIIAIFVGVPLIYKSVIDAQFGLYFLTCYSYFLFFIGRLLLPTKLPMGVGVEVLTLALSCGVIISETQHRSKLGWTFLDNPISYIFVVYETYNVLQAFNPNATSLAGWLVSTRGIVFELIVYLLLVKLFSNLNLIKNFTKLWLFLSLLAALYGVYQEIFGYTSFEWMDIYSNPQTIFLIQNWAFLRKFSFLSDVATFGIVMAFSGIFCGVLAMGPFEPKTRFFLAVSAVIMIISMTFSGTRTATAMVPAGAFMYILMHIDNRKTVAVLAFLVVCSLAILYGPFYGTSISRIRSTFEPSQDASMSVREYNRARAQPYIHSHPIGGGVNTTDAEGETLSPGHQLAGFPTDSGFLKTALTIGWIGLIILMVLYFTVIAIGVTNFYKARDPVIKALYGAYIAAFFSLIVANYTQPAMGQKPTALIVFSIFVLMPNLIRFDRKE
jgi:putative inorganic carbon (hco3(-)) transporter